MAQQFKAPIIEDFEADDIRAYYDSSVLRVWHLDGKPRTYKIINKVQRITTEFRNETSLRAVLTLVDRDGVVALPFVLNPTNRNVIRQLYGNAPREWVGKLITLYPTTTDVGGETKDCIRVRPTVPGKAAHAAPKNRQGVTVAKAAQAITNAIVDTAIDAARLAFPLVDAAEPSDADDSGFSAASDEDDEPPIGALETDRTNDVIQ
jgi:hypothetical protein